MSNGNGAPSYAAFPAYATWAVHFGYDGWIYATCQDDARLAGELTGREWMDMVTNGIKSKGGKVWYTVERRDEPLPPIVQKMIDFMSEALDAGCAYEPAAELPAPPDDDDVTVLMRKSREGDLLWVEDLLDRHVDLEMEDKQGCTALSYACFHGQLEIVKKLLGAGADPNHASKSKNTPLMNALKAEHHRAEICLELLSHGANPNAKNKQKQTALDLCPPGDQSITQIIRRYKGKKAKELIAWYNRLWFLTTVTIVAAVAAIWFGVWLAMRLP